MQEVPQPGADDIMNADRMIPLDLFRPGVTVFTGQRD